MVKDDSERMVAGETDLKEIISANGKSDQFKTLLGKEQNENHVKKKFEYIEKAKYPKSVFFIVINEFCERFSYYGMRTILSLYLNQVLLYNTDEATIIYHSFQMSAYFFPLVGAIIADSFLGKFRTIFYISIIYAIGNVTIAGSAIPYVGTSRRVVCLTGLFLIAFGTGGIKPCVSAFGGDQFKLPQQEIQLAQFFSIFYFAINAGSLISTFLTPYIRYNVHCFGQDSCYSAAFGLPAVLMISALVIFLCGKRFYVTKKPEGNIFVLVIKCIAYALVSKIRNRGEKKPHWLDHAEDKYDKSLIADIKSINSVFLLFVPLPVFWALYDQQGSRWTFQALFLDASVGSIGTIKPEHMQIINPLLILILIPIFEVLIYPGLAKCKLLRTPLQRMSCGGLLTALAFVVSGILQLRLADTYPVLPAPGIGQVRIYNGLNCSITLDSESDLLQGSIDAFDVLQIKQFPTSDMDGLHFNVTTDCPLTKKHQRWNSTIKFDDGANVALTYIITGNVSAKIEGKLLPGYDDVTKSKKGYPKFRIIYSVKNDTDMMFKLDSYSETLSLEKNGLSTPMKELETSGRYKIKIKDEDYDELNFGYGGVYSLLVVENNNEFIVKLTEIQPSNTIHILWQFPQYFIITCSEIMVSITGLSLSYSQAPVSMKSVVSAAWLLTTSVGNLLVIIIAEFQMKDQAVEFFVFAGMMTAVMCVFIIIAARYKYVNPTEDKTEDAPQK